MIIVDVELLMLGAQKILGICCTPFRGVTLLASIKYSLVPLLLGDCVDQCVSIVHLEIESHLLFHLAAELEWLDSRRYLLKQHIAIL